MTSPRYSIIIPAYNAESSIEQCVDTILNQEETDFEMIIVDDGSTDNTLHCITSVAKEDDRIKVIHQNNGGPSSARNKALECAIGEWIVFCDADDQVGDNWLNNYTEIIKCNPESELVVLGINYIFNSGENRDRQVGVDYVGDPTELALLLSQKKILGYLWCKAFRNDVITRHNIRFNKLFRFREDDIFVMEYLNRISHVFSTTRVGYNYHVPDFLEKYREHTSSFELNKEYYCLSKKLTGSSHMTEEAHISLLQSLYWNIKTSSMTVMDARNAYVQITGRERFKFKYILFIIRLFVNYLK
ncbi:MAG: glycosyltransferase family 2 protein [Muribaculaceae bacterium]|nr:glycosyltransferase family 2 protein [Muribaculaceae bacterium]